MKEIYPVMSDNVSMSQQALKGKVEKWNKIAFENFKQCERADMAVVFEILSLREEKGMKQSELAELIGTTEATLSRFAAIMSSALVMAS